MRASKPKVRRRSAARRAAARAPMQPAPRGGPASDRAIAFVRRACLALPDATEKEAWGTPTFRVRERLFVMFADNHHGDGRLAIWCNAAPGAQEVFVGSDADAYFVPPYVGVSGWLGVRLDRGLSEADVVARIEAAHAAALEALQAKRRPRAATKSSGPRRSR